MKLPPSFSRRTTRIGTSAGGIYFDGRDDYTLQKTALGSTSLIKEGHYTIRAQDVYLGFAVEHGAAPWTAAHRELCARYTRRSCH